MKAAIPKQTTVNIRQSDNILFFGKSMPVGQIIRKSTSEPGRTSRGLLPWRNTRIG